jgi:hypothetical protein
VVVVRFVTCLLQTFEIGHPAEDLAFLPLARILNGNRRATVAVGAELRLAYGADSMVF